MRLPNAVTIVEVGLRDGIQAEATFVPTATKVALLEAVVAAGIRHLEATSFVHPQAVPQMADAAAVMASLRRSPGVTYAALVPNLRGAERALAAGADELRCVIMTSETFNQRNVRMAVAESLGQWAEIAAHCRAAERRLVCALGTTFGCPYEGDIAPGRVLDLVGQLVAAGADGVILCDTTGMANPLQVARLTGAVLDRWPTLEVTLHFHNTRGMGLANVLGGLEAGVTRFEASLGGTGGCPFAPRATGNICTEDTVHLLHEMGVATGLDLGHLVAAAEMMQAVLGRELPGQVMKAGPRSRRHGPDGTCLA